MEHRDSHIEIEKVKRMGPSDYIEGKLEYSLKMKDLSVATNIDGENQAKASKLRKKRRKKPKSMPRRPLSAYNFFFSEKRAMIINEHKEKGLGQHQDAADLFSSMGKRIAKMWKELPEDKMTLYKRLAAQDAKRYQLAMDEYRYCEARKKMIQSGIDHSRASPDHHETVGTPILTVDGSAFHKPLAKVSPTQDIVSNNDGKSPPPIHTRTPNLVPLTVQGNYAQPHQAFTPGSNLIQVMPNVSPSSRPALNTFLGPPEVRRVSLSDSSRGLVDFSQSKRPPYLPGIEDNTLSSLAPRGGLLSTLPAIPQRAGANHGGEPYVIALYTMPPQVSTDSRNLNYLTMSGVSSSSSSSPSRTLQRQTLLQGLSLSDRAFDHATLTDGSSPSCFSGNYRRYSDTVLLDRERLIPQASPGRSIPSTTHTTATPMEEDMMPSTAAVAVAAAAAAAAVRDGADEDWHHYHHQQQQHQRTARSHSLPPNASSYSPFLLYELLRRKARFGQQHQHQHQQYQHQHQH